MGKRDSNIGLLHSRCLRALTEKLRRSPYLAVFNKVAKYTDRPLETA